MLHIAELILIPMPHHIGNHYMTVIGMLDKQGTIGGYRRALGHRMKTTHVTEEDMH